VARLSAARNVFDRIEVVRLRKEEKLSWGQIAKHLKISSGSARRAYDLIYEKKVVR
jgi:hypothetical protein